MPKRFAVRPPELFPRCSYCALADYVDELILADTFLYSRQSHQNRTPIRTPDGRMWLTVPLEHGRGGVSIRDARPAGRLWAGKFRRALRFNYSATPYYEHYIDGVVNLLSREWTSLGELTVATTRLVLDMLRIETSIITASSLPSPPRRLIDVVDEWDGRLAVPDDAAGHDQRLVSALDVTSLRDTPYRQAFDGFEPDLSALDLLFNWGPEALTMLRERRNVEPIGKGHVKPAPTENVG